MDEYALPISAVEHFSYCPRQAALITLDGEWSDNVHTAIGSAQHSSVDRETRRVRRNGVECWLSLPVFHQELEVIGVCDCVELHPRPVPVEYKPVRSARHLAPASQQLAIQALCLETMFDTAVEYGVLYAHKENRRQEVLIDEPLRAAAIRTLEAVRQMLDSGVMPPRASDARCRDCSLRDVCLVCENVAPLRTDGHAALLFEEDG